MVDTQVNTDKYIFESYLKKPMKEQNMNTEPVIFGTPKPEMSSAMVQTEPQIDEHGCPAEPIPLTTANEPDRTVNEETGSNSSLLDIPPTEEVLDEIVLPPPQEPEEDPITDDWAKSTLYEYVF